MRTVDEVLDADAVSEAVMRVIASIVVHGVIAEGCALVEAEARTGLRGTPTAMSEL